MKGPMRLALVLIAIVVVAAGCTRANQGPGSSATSNMKNATTANNSSGVQPRAQSACELLTATEIAGFLKAPAVKKDELNSGKNEMTGVDRCNWYVREGSNEGIELRVRRAESGEGSELLVFSAAKGDAVEHDVKRDREAEPLLGVGDEAVYSPYPVGPGGSIALRVGRRAVTIAGSASKDSLIAAAKLAAGRL